MNDLRPLWFGTMDDKHHPRWVRRTVVSKRGLKGALVVVVSGQQLCHLTPAIVGLEYLGVSVAREFCHSFHHLLRSYRPNRKRSSLFGGHIAFEPKQEVASGY